MKTGVAPLFRYRTSNVRSSCSSTTEVILALSACVSFSCGLAQIRSALAGCSFLPSFWPSSDLVDGSVRVGQCYPIIFLRNPLFYGFCTGRTQISGKTKECIMYPPQMSADYKTTEDYWTKRLEQRKPRIQRRSGTHFSRCLMPCCLKPHRMNWISGCKSRLWCIVCV